MGYDPGGTISAVSMQQLEFRGGGALGAILAAAIITYLYSEGGYLRALAGLVLLAVLITPNASGTSMLAGLLNWLSQLLKGTLEVL